MWHSFASLTAQERRKHFSEIKLHRLELLTLLWIFRSNPAVNCDRRVIESAVGGGMPPSIWFDFVIETHRTHFVSFSSSGTHSSCSFRCLRCLPGRWPAERPSVPAADIHQRKKWKRLYEQLMRRELSYSGASCVCAWQKKRRTPYTAVA